jgi:hypothetical protein
MTKPYKHQIKTVYVYKNGTIAVLDQNNNQMPEFQGMRTFPLMKRLKDRINRQKPCFVKWFVQEGTDFAGTTTEMYYK